jgi:hypothetical protein
VVGGAAAASAATAAAAATAAPPGSLRREGRTGALLRAACLSHLLREYARLRDFEEFGELPPHLQEEVEQMYVWEGNVYLGDSVAAKK